MPISSININKKRKFIADGVFYAEINEFFIKELTNDGYSGVEIKSTPSKTEITIRCTSVKQVLGEKGKRIRELTNVFIQRFGFKAGELELFAEMVRGRGLCAAAQTESLKYKLIQGLAVRRACYSVMRLVMESGAKGVECTVSGKVRTQRAKAMIFRTGYMVKSGNPSEVFTDECIRHVQLKQGSIGVRVKIMLPHDPKGIMGPKKQQADVVTILEPKEDM